MQKVIEIKERSSTLIERRKKKQKRNFIILLVLLGIVLMFLLYFQTPFSHIGKINVTGQQIETEEYYIKHSGLSTGDSFWRFDPKEVQNRLKNQPTVKSVKVERSWLNEVNIQIKENKRTAILKTGDRYNYVLENGELLSSRATVDQTNLPILLDMPDRKFRSKLVKQLKRLDQDILLMISQIEKPKNTTNDNLVQLYMSDGFEVKVNVTNLASKLQYYPSIVAQLGTEKKGVINLEIGGYYNTFKLEYK